MGDNKNIPFIFKLGNLAYDNVDQVPCRLCLDEYDYVAYTNTINNYVEIMEQLFVC